MRKQTQSLHNLLPAPKAQVSFSLGQEDHSSQAEPRASGVKRVPSKGELLPKKPQPEELRASGVKRVPAKGEFLPKAESPTEDTAQRGQATGQG